MVTLPIPKVLPAKPQGQDGQKVDALISAFRRRFNVIAQRVAPTNSELTHEFAVIVCDLQNLTHDDDEGWLRPTTYALKTVTDLVSEASQQMRGHFPYGAVCSDGEGGIRVEWDSGDHSVRLVVPSVKGGHSYIYYESDDTFDTSQEVSAFKLAGWLDWLIKA
jgi:hypothetical protein